MMRTVKNFSPLKRIQDRALGSPPDLSLGSTVLAWNRPRDAPSCSRHPPSNLFSTHHLWNHLGHPQPPRSANTVF